MATPIFSWKKHMLRFKQEAGTSRGVLYDKPSYILTLQCEDWQHVGECSLIPSLSIDTEAEIEKMLRKFEQQPDRVLSIPLNEIRHLPALATALEMIRSQHQGAEKNKYVYYPSLFTEGKDTIPMNGLVWMGSIEKMRQQAHTLVEQGFGCIKLKIGTDWSSERELLTDLRTEYPKLKIRVDANGAFSTENVYKALDNLARLQIHSIEQPIRAGNPTAMATICKTSPIPIALDEEMIGAYTHQQKVKLLEVIRPQYLIFKPSLHGGFGGCEEWIDIARAIGNIKWWMTSALESNIGLNAISQWTYIHNIGGEQGLGTGGLFVNNFDTPVQKVGTTMAFSQI